MKDLQIATQPLTPDNEIDGCMSPNDLSKHEQRGLLWERKLECRHCAAELKRTFLNLGHAPPSNWLLSEAAISEPELFVPLRLLVCTSCWLVQTADHTSAESLFSDDYPYFSSISKSWLEHAKEFARHSVQTLGLGQSSFVIEVASNDGYLLQNFHAMGIPCLGVEPTASTAAVAESKGIEVVREFFGAALAKKIVNQRGMADLIVANNVLAHVPDINDFCEGLAFALKRRGSLSIEFPSLLSMIEGNQFDTAYHEHFSYLSLISVRKILKSFELSVHDVELLDTHGGSYRIWCSHASDEREESPRLRTAIDREISAGLNTLDAYSGMQHRAESVKYSLLQFLLEAKQKGLKVAGYGAAAKGNTLLNFSGIKSDLIYAIYDAAESKQEKFCPGSHIPIRAPREIRYDMPDIILVLPWNIANEIQGELRYVREWGARLFRAIPKIEEIM